MVIIESVQSRKINVLTICNGLPNPLNVHHWVFVAEQIKALSEHCNITAIAPVLLARPGRKFREQREQAAQIPYSGKLNRALYYRPRYLDLPRFSHQLNDYSMLFSILLCIARHKVKVDLIHSHFAYPAGYVGALLGCVLRKPMILTVWGSDINMRTRPDFEVPLWRERIFYALCNVDYIIASSDALKERLVDLGIESGVSVIYNGISTERFHPRDRCASRRKLGLPIDTPTVLFIGNLVPIKALDVLLRAVAHIEREGTRLHLVLVGDGPLHEDLKRLAAELELSNVEFRGRQPNEEIPWLMSAADVLVLPSLNEGFGMVILESIACATPVVASRVGGVPEIINADGLGILVDPGDPGVLAEAIQKALSREWEIGTLISRALDFDLRHTARQIADLYQEIASRGLERNGHLV